MLPPVGAAWPTLLAASNACLSASGEDTSGLGAPLRTAMPIPVRAEVAAARNDLSLPDKLVDRRTIGHENVGGLAGVEAGDQRAGGAVTRAEGVAVLPLEARQQFVHRRLQRGRNERVDLGSISRAWHEQRKDDCQHAHDE
jgi:hypothetical protein